MFVTRELVRITYNKLSLKFDLPVFRIEVTFEAIYLRGENASYETENILFY